ncbi:MAG: alpha/beta hydrolase [Chloroflexi bacterium]|nr:alpha/beta hydrolase [Chloroflexota bacterium]
MIEIRSWKRKMQRVAKPIKLFFCWLTILTGMGAIYEIIASATDKRKYPPPGSRVDIGGCRLHIQCMGEGSPTVILESGSGNFSLDWSPVQPEIAQYTHVCAYDRAGHGWSDASKQPRSVQQTVEELHTLLSAMDINGPYILVGHSLGGLYMQYFARCYPDETAGVVLIDSAHPDLYLHLPPLVRKREAIRLKKMGRAAILGAQRLGVLSLPEVSSKLAPKVQQAISALWLRPAFWHACIEQNKCLDQRVAELFKTLDPFPEVPLIVLTPPNADWSKTIGPEFPALWLNCQKKLASLTANGELIIVEGSSHDIHHDQPQLVIDAIKRVVEIARCR